MTTGSVKWQSTLLALLLVFSGVVRASIIAYEWTEGGPGNGVDSTHASIHGTTGPVLADDFTPAVSGRVVRVDWWGTAPVTAGAASDLWEITFHSDSSGAPSWPAIAQHFVSAAGVDSDGDGIFFFSANWSPMDVLLTSGQDYWFSVANASASSSTPWNWADALGAGPTVGSEQYDAMRSVGGAPSVVAGPHDGPWSSITDQDFAYRIWVEVPEPATLTLMSLGLVGLGFRRHRNKSSA
ncbi:MAG: PEP-CTERM sorting domain-containing protein [Gammaproteobacteria bacterium]|nr:PEP-CTERM sorting domain-containing protein [Gammaproteobacteria bacterium]